MRAIPLHFCVHETNAIRFVYQTSRECLRALGQGLSVPQHLKPHTMHCSSSLTHGSLEWSSVAAKSRPVSYLGVAICNFRAGYPI
jgi:hypothetical protein